MKIELNKNQLDIIDTALSFYMAKALFSGLNEEGREAEDIRDYLRSVKD